MATVHDCDAGRHDCPFNEFFPCKGAKCMAWTWEGLPYDRCETDNLIDTEEGPRPAGAPTAPEGEGWEADGPPYKKGYHRSGKDKLPLATGQRWMRKRLVTLGFCGRIGREGYF